MPRAKRSAAKRAVAMKTVPRILNPNAVMRSMPQTGWAEPKQDCKFALQLHSTLPFFSNSSSGSSLEPAKEKAIRAV